MSEYYLSVNDDGDVVCHHGVKGMKWGQHIFGKDSNTSRSNSKSTSKNKKTGERVAKYGGAILGGLTVVGAYTTAKDNQKNKKNDHVKKMTDEELQKAIKRQSLESNYKKNLKNSKQDNSLESIKQMTDASNDLIKISKKENEKHIKTVKKRQRMDLSKMTDQQLRDRINRENLELQYNRMFNQDDVVVNKGALYADKALNATSTVLATTSSALTIALAIKKLTS